MVKLKVPALSGMYIWPKGALKRISSKKALRPKKNRLNLQEQIRYYEFITRINILHYPNAFHGTDCMVPF